MIRKIPSVEGLVSLNKSGDDVIYQTQEVDIRIDYLKTGSGGSANYNIKKVSTHKLIGLWLKIYAPEVEGICTVRDVCFPDDLQKKVTWEGARLD